MANISRESLIPRDSLSILGFRRSRFLKALRVRHGHGIVAHQRYRVVVEGGVGATQQSVWLSCGGSGCGLVQNDWLSPSHIGWGISDPLSIMSNALDDEKVLWGINRLAGLISDTPEAGKHPLTTFCNQDGYKKPRFKSQV